MTRTIDSLGLPPKPASAFVPTWTYQDRMPQWKREEARRMRRNPTRAEAALWAGIRKRQLGVRWGRQRPMFGYIVDFWCASARLAVEVDGSSHSTRATYDAKRDAGLARHGVRTLRFTNDQVMHDLEAVLEVIKQAQGA